jgi:hypothetical protein
MEGVRLVKDITLINICEYSEEIRKTKCSANYLGPRGMK